MGLADKALLAHVSISVWVGRKLDKVATDSVETRYATDSKVGNYTKKLLPGAVELDALTNHAQAIRAFFREQSLPWHTDGSRIMPSKNYIEFTQEFSRRKQAFEFAAETFLNAYPQLQANAKAKLGSLYNDNEYPSVESLRDKFKCDISFMPIPDVDDFRVAISDAEKQTFLDSMKSIESAAMRDCWNRLHDCVSKAAMTLSNPASNIRHSLFENITECCTLLSKLNVTDDANLESMRRNVEKLAASVSVDNMRAMPNERDDAAKKLADLTSQMSAFMGQ